MRVNADHFSSENSRLIYVLGRLNNQVVIYIYHRREKESPNPYIFYKKILNQLVETYKDIDRLENARRDFIRLQILKRLFKTFIADFQRLAYASRLAEDYLI